MTDVQMGGQESSFAELIWNNEPISAADLSKLAEEEFQWKKTTAYTVLKRLCNKGIFKNTRGIVTSKISREEYNSLHSQNYVGNHFEGSLPAFLAAFTRGKGISDAVYEEIRSIIDSARENDNE